MSDEKKVGDARELLKNLDGRIKQVASHLMDHDRHDALWTREAVHKTIVQSIKLHLMDKRKTATEPFLCPSCDRNVAEWSSEPEKPCQTCAGLGKVTWLEDEGRRFCSSDCPECVSKTP